MDEHSEKGRRPWSNEIPLLSDVCFLLHGRIILYPACAVSDFVQLTHCIAKKFGFYMKSAGHSCRGTVIIDPQGIIRHISMNHPVSFALKELFNCLSIFWHLFGRMWAEMLMKCSVSCKLINSLLNMEKSASRWRPGQDSSFLFFCVLHSRTVETVILFCLCNLLCCRRCYNHTHSCQHKKGYFSSHP